MSNCRTKPSTCGPRYISPAAQQKDRKRTVRSQVVDAFVFIALMICSRTTWSRCAWALLCWGTPRVLERRVLGMWRGVSVLWVGWLDWVSWSAEGGRDWYDQECMSGMDVLGGGIEVWCIDGVIKWCCVWNEAEEFIPSISKPHPHLLLPGSCNNSILIASQLTQILHPS
jgi:hypothetical protein